MASLELTVDVLVVVLRVIFVMTGSMGTWDYRWIDVSKLTLQCLFSMGASFFPVLPHPVLSELRGFLSSINPINSQCTCFCVVNVWPIWEDVCNGCVCHEMMGELFHSWCNMWEDVKEGQCYCSYRCYFWVIFNTSFLIWLLSLVRKLSIRLKPHLSIDIRNPLIKPIQVVNPRSIQGPVPS